MHRFCVLIARLAITAWVGAAVLFVIVGVREVTLSGQVLPGGGFDSATRDALVLLRFPAYYVTGFALVGVGLLATACAGSASGWSRPARFATLGLLSVALLLMISDYVWIYQPLVEMVTPPGATRTSDFEKYHNASKYINVADVTLCGIAAALLCWPTSSGRASALAED